MYYSKEELACNCCGELPSNGIDPKLMDLLDAMCDSVGYKLTINCCYRCNAHNLEVGGVPNSQHNADPCTAADLDATSIGVDNLAAIAENCGADGIGVYYDSCFVHVDVRDGRIGSQYRWEG